jgi:hypothetical protein
MSGPDQIIQLADKFWDLQNYITGFVLVQMIAFLYALGTNYKFHKYVFIKKDIVRNSIIVAGFLYSISLGACFYFERGLRSSDNVSCAITTVFIGRLIAIFVATAFGYFIISKISDPKEWEGKD